VEIILNLDEKVGNHQCGFDIKDKLLLTSFAFVRYWRENGSTMRQHISGSQPVIQLGETCCTVIAMSLRYTWN
jgi:hypothetical protein